jgi:hypothetical protein
VSNAKFESCIGIRLQFCLGPRETSQFPQSDDIYTTKYGSGPMFRETRSNMDILAVKVLLRAFEKPKLNFFESTER